MKEGKMSRASETCGTPSSLPTNICIEEVPEVDDRQRSKKNIGRNNS